MEKTALRWIFWVFLFFPIFSARFSWCYLVFCVYLEPDFLSLCLSEAPPVILTIFGLEKKGGVGLPICTFF